MALVKILAANLFAGANFQKLEVGKTYDVDDAIAEKWITDGKAEESKEKGVKLHFEVSPRLRHSPPKSARFRPNWMTLCCRFSSCSRQQLRKTWCMLMHSPPKLNALTTLLPRWLKQPRRRNNHG